MAMTSYERYLAVCKLREPDRTPVSPLIMTFAARLGAFVRVILPLSLPGLVATSLFCFLLAWEEFLIALIFTSSPAAKTIPVAIAEFTGRHAIDFGMMATGGVIAAIPPILIALVFQRYLISGLSSGAVKG